MPEGDEGLVTRNPRASMSWMSAVVSLLRVAPDSLNGSFGVRLLAGGLRKSAGLLMAQSATFVAPPSSEKNAGVAGI